MSDHRRELKEALEGRRRHPADFAVLAAEVRALAALGRAADISERLVEAPSLPPQPGWSPADIAIIAALELAAHDHQADAPAAGMWAVRWLEGRPGAEAQDRKSTRLNSSHLVISYAVFCLKKKKKQRPCSDITRSHPGLRPSSPERLDKL